MLNNLMSTHLLAAENTSASQVLSASRDQPLSLGKRNFDDVEAKDLRIGESNIFQAYSKF